MEDVEVQEKGRWLGRASLLSARKGDGSPRFCVCVLCTFFCLKCTHMQMKDQAAFPAKILKNQESGQKKELKGRKKSQ